MKTEIPKTQYTVDCNAYGTKPLNYPTISESLDDNRIVSVTQQPDGRFQILEKCDDYFAAYLTREQLLAWAEELKALAAMPNDPKLSHGANNRKREFAAKRKMKEQPPLAPARC
jgi:hypothetical protein